MARIPTLSDAPRVSTRANISPTQRPGEAGAGFRQVSQIAGQMGEGLMNLRRKQIAESNKVAYTKSNIELSKNFNDLDREMEEEYRSNKPNFDGYAEDGMERLNQRRDSILEKAPESARDSINLAFDEKMAKMESRFQNKESFQKSQYATFETKNQLKLASQDSYQTADPIEVMNKMNNLAVSVESSSLFDARGKAVLRNQINELPKDMLNGVLDRENTAEMKEVLDSMDDPVMGRVYGQMDPKVVTKAKTSLERKLKYKETEGINEVKGKYSDGITGLSMGTLKPKNPEHKQILTNLKNEIGTKMGESGRELIANIEAHEAASNLLSEHAFDVHKVDSKVSASEISSGISDPLQQAASKGRVGKIIESQRQTMLKDMKDDPANYIAKNDSGVALSAREMVATKNPRAYNDMMNAMNSRYDQMGTPVNQREFMSAPIKNHFEGSFKTFITNGDHKSAEALIADFDTMTNGAGHKHFDELDIPKEYAVVSELPDKQDRLNAVKNLMDTELKGAYDLRRLDSNLKEGDIKVDLSRHPILEAMSVQDGGTRAGAQHTKAMYDTVYNEYKRVVVTNPNMDHKTAIKEAWKGFEKRYVTLKSRGGTIPISRKHNTVNTQNFIDTYTSGADFTKDFDIRLPKKPSGISTTKEEMNDSLKTEGRWVYNRKAEGLTLMGRNDLGRYGPVFDNKGKPVIRTFEQINNEVYTNDVKKEKARKFDEFVKKRSGRGRDL